MKISEKLKQARAARAVEAVRLINCGMSVIRTARELGVGEGAVRTYLSEHNRNFKAPRIFTDNDIDINEEIKTRKYN